MEAGSLSSPVLGRSPLAGVPDRVLRWGLTGLAALILLLIAFFFVRLSIEASPAFAKSGVFGFVFDNDWDVSNDVYGALPLIVGTLITSAVALLIGVPVAVAAALYVTEGCPIRLRGSLTGVIGVAAGVPLVVYGLWGFFFPVPKLGPAGQWFAEKFSFPAFVGGPGGGAGFFVAGLVLGVLVVAVGPAVPAGVIGPVAS